jgi:hypothetical protein
MWEALGNYGVLMQPLIWKKSIWIFVKAKSTTTNAKICCESGRSHRKEKYVF